MTTSSLPTPSLRGTSDRLSVPPKPTAPRAITDDERTTMVAAADVLMPRTDRDPAPSDLPDFPKWLDTAVHARADAFEVILAAVGGWIGHSPSELDTDLRALASQEPRIFSDLTSVLAGAYLMSPQVRTAIGYPGQGRNPAPLDQAAEELSDGLLDPVLERGYIYVPAAGE